MSDNEILEELKQLEMNKEWTRYKQIVNRFWQTVKNEAIG
jgi:hypothetical protein